MNIVVDIIVSVALYKPLGIAGLIIGTLAANVMMTCASDRAAARGLRRRPGGHAHAMITIRIVVASAAWQSSPGRSGS